MTEEDSDDTSYLVKVSSCAGQFHQLVNEFFAATCAGVGSIDVALIKDKTIPWPVRSYYALAVPAFHARLMQYVDEPRKALN